MLAAVRGHEDRLAALRAQPATEQPALADARYPRMWTAEELQAQALEAGEAVLMFFVGQERSTAWLIQPNRVDIARLPGRAQIEEAVKAYLDVVRSPALKPHQETGTRLHGLLLEEMAPRIQPGARLVIVPHGILHYVPFEALPGSDGRLLLERADVSYAPSVSSFAFLRRLTPPSDRGRAIVAVGNPNLGRNGEGDERSALPLEWISALPRLPHTQREIRRIAGGFRDGRFLEGDAATETELARANLERAAALHFATHALVYEARPDRSGLALTAAPPSSDGLLQVREVYRLKLASALVTLSACETALGRNLNGEGIVGLSRAFFFAGANAVTASLWNVSDKSTADLMEAFYGELAKGEPVDRALRRAKLSLLTSGGERAHPFYWAAFVALGNGSLRVPLEPAPLVGQVTLVAGLVAAALAVTTGFFVSKRRRRPAPSALASPS